MRSEYTGATPRPSRISTRAASAGGRAEEEWEGDERELEMDSEDVDEGMEPRPIGSGGAFLFAFTGFALVAAGALFATASYHSWQVQQLAEMLATLGIHSGSMIVGGLVLFGIGRLGRTLTKLSARPPARDSELVDAVTRMSDNVSLLAGTLAQMQEQVTYLGLREPIVNVSAPPPDGDLVMLYRDQKDAVFRLAASLDKLAKTVIDQVAAEIGSLDRHFAGVIAEVQATKTSLESSLARTTQAARPTQTARPTQPARPTQTARPTAARSQTPARRPVERIDLSEQDEIVLEDARAESLDDLSPLSFLEGLKQIAPRSQNPHSPNVEAPPLDFDLLDAGHSGHENEGPRAPLPGKTQPRTRTPN